MNRPDTHGPGDQDAELACPHCAERPPAGHHLCPLNLEADGCTCCGVCAKICSDIQRHIQEHTHHVFVDRGTGEVEINYYEPEENEEENPLGRPGSDDPGDVGLTA